MERIRLISASSSTPAILGRGRAARPRAPPDGLLVRDQGRGGPGQGFLPEERGCGRPAVEVDEPADDGREEYDDERAADLPVRAERQRPRRVAVLRAIYVQ